MPIVPRRLVSLRATRNCGRKLPSAVPNTRCSVLQATANPITLSTQKKLPNPITTKMLPTLWCSHPPPPAKSQTEYTFLPACPSQPIFYPVCNEQYAIEITEKWNAKDQGVGYVTRFEVNTAFLAKYEPKIVGARHHEEYWIPAEELDDFNDAIVGKIAVVGE